MSGDRRLMLVDDKGQGVTQRDLPALAAVVASVEGDQATLHFGGNQVSASFEPTRRLSVTVWSSPVDAALAPEAVNATLSGWFGQSLRLVQMDGQAARLAGGDWAGAPVPVGFADEYPLLVTTTGSLAALNATLAERGEPAVGMDRFRTNLLIAHDVPWDEDLWEAVEIGGVRIDLVKPCTRCIVTTQDQETGARTGGNPIPALSRTRMSATGAWSACCSAGTPCRAARGGCRSANRYGCFPAGPKPGRCASPPAPRRPMNQQR